MESKGLIENTLDWNMESQEYKDVQITKKKFKIFVYVPLGGANRPIVFQAFFKDPPVTLSNTGWLE